MKNSALSSRHMMYGFNPNKDTTGRPVGAAVVKLTRRNAYELVGLRRPKPLAGMMPRMA